MKTNYGNVNTLMLTFVFFKYIQADRVEKEKRKAVLTMIKSLFFVFIKKYNLLFYSFTFCYTLKISHK